jgi:hypothetical protein
MNPYQSSASVLAVNSTRMPKLDNTTNVAAEHNPRPLSHTANNHDHYPIVQFCEPSPPQKPVFPHLYRSLPPSSRYDQYFDPTVPSSIRPAYLLTPPKQNGEFLQLRTWHAQQQDDQDHASSFLASTTRCNTPGVVQNHLQSSIRPHPSQLNEIRQWQPHTNDTLAYLPEPHAYSTGSFQHQHLPHYAHLAQHKPKRWLQPHNNSADSSMQYAESWDPLMQPKNTPPTTLVFSRSQIHTLQRSPPSQLPPIQQWPTQHLDHRASYVGMPPCETMFPVRHALAVRASPGHDDLSPPDRVLLEKMEAFDKKAQDARCRRQSRATSDPSRVRARKRSAATSTKRKRSAQAVDCTAPTSPPSFRLSHLPANWSIQAQNIDGDPYGCLPASSPGGDQDQAVSSNLDNSSMNVISPRPSQVMAERACPDPVDCDALPQTIATVYEDYKWSITHYEIDPSGAYCFAQSWLEDLFAINIRPGDYKWHAHSTWGFIKDGTRFSFIVLHNAADPFEKGVASTSTTSIGVYGRHWHYHEEIHLKTFAPGIHWLLQWCEEQKCISVKQKWTCDMPQAGEKRFHRAYWLAATRGPLGGLLNQGTMNDEPHDVPEEELDEVFEVTKEDLTNEWDNSEKEAQEVWARVLKEIEVIGDVRECWYEHVVTGSSEWDQDDERGGQVRSMEACSSTAV